MARTALLQNEISVTAELKGFDAAVRPALFYDRRIGTLEATIIGRSEIFAH